MRAPIVGGINIRHGGCDPAFGHDRMCLSQQRFTDNADARAVAERFDCRAQSSTARTDDQHIVLVSLKLFSDHSTNRFTTVSNPESNLSPADECKDRRVQLKTNSTMQTTCDAR